MEIIIIFFLAILLFINCAALKPANKEDIERLEKARKAAVEAERELSRLRQERMRLEKELESE